MAEIPRKAGLTFPINVQRYSQNHKIAFFEPPYVGGIRGNTSALYEGFTAKKLSSRECHLYLYNSELAFLSHPLWGVGVTYAIHL